MTGPRPAGHEIALRLSALREAGAKLRRRPARDTLDALGRLLDALRDPGSPFRRALQSELPEATGFSPQTVREGLRSGLASWDAASLRALVEREIGGPERLDAPGREATALVSGFPATAVVLAGAIPLPTLVALLAPLALRSPVLVKPASRDRVTPHRFARALAQIDAELGHCIAVVDCDSRDDDALRALLSADCVVATGSDDTIAAIQSRVVPPRRFVGHGHRVSVAALGDAATRGAALADAARALALDVAQWDQLGCLSPLAVYVISGDPGGAERGAAALADELAAIEARMPRGEIDPAAAASVAHERADAQARRAAGRDVSLRSSKTTAWSVVREADAELRPAPLHRFVRVHPVRDPAALSNALRPLGPHLAAVALGAIDLGSPEGASLARDLADLGASRLCRPGALQTPPLDWHHDNRGILLPLARWTDLES